MVRAERALGCDARIVTTNDHGEGLLHELPLGSWGEWQGLPVRAFGRWSPPLRPLREFQVAPALAPWLWHELPSRWLYFAMNVIDCPRWAAISLAAVL